MYRVVLRASRKGLGFRVWGLGCRLPLGPISVSKLTSATAVSGLLRLACAVDARSEANLPGLRRMRTEVLHQN